MKIYLDIGLWLEDCCYINVKTDSDISYWNTLNHNARKSFLYKKFNQDMGRSKLHEKKPITIKYRKL